MTSDHPTSLFLLALLSLMSIEGGGMRGCNMDNTCWYPNAQNPSTGTGRLVRVLAFSTEDDTGTVLYSAVPILANAITGTSVTGLRTIRVLACPTEDDTGTGLFD